MNADAKESAAFAFSWVYSSDHLAIEKTYQQKQKRAHARCDRRLYPFVVVSMILNEDSLLLLMYVKIPAAILDPGAADSKDNGTS